MTSPFGRAVTVSLQPSRLAVALGRSCWKREASTDSGPCGQVTRGATKGGREMVGPTTGWAPTEIEQIQRQLTSILASSVFSLSRRQCRFLSYIVQATLAGGADRLNQRVIGIEVFDRPDSFDPVVDSIVRVEA